MKTKRIALIIINYNGERIRYKNKSILLSCIESFSHMNYPDYRIIVVDNGSSDNSREVARRCKVDFVPIKKSPYNISYSIATNVGIRYAQKKYNPDYFVIMNDDLLTKDNEILNKFVAAVEKERAGVAGCKFLFPDGRIQNAAFERTTHPVSRGIAEQDRGQYGKTEEVFSVIGVFMLITKDTLKKVGLFDERLFGYEDIDYCVRAREAGFKVLYIGSVRITHLAGFTHSSTVNQKSGSKSETAKVRCYYAFRSMGYFLKKYPDLFSTSEKISGILFFFGSFLFTMTGKDNNKSIFNLRLAKPASYISVMIDGIIDGFSLSKNSEILNPEYLP
jgi:GT2 family glycosyltransferase